MRNASVPRVGTSRCGCGLIVRRYQQRENKQTPACVTRIMFSPAGVKPTLRTARQCLTAGLKAALLAAAI